MLKMKEIETVRKMFFEEGKNISNIEKESGFDRKTIRKYLTKDDFRKEPLQDNHKYAKLDGFKLEIDSWIESDKRMRIKQRHTAKRVFNRLKEKYQDFGVSYRTVAYYVKEKKREIFKTDNSSLPLLHKEGESQIDFGKAQFMEKKVLCDGSYLTLSFPFSNAGYTQLLKGENFECFTYALNNIYGHINGVPYRQWFDNTSVAVSKILKGHDRQLTESFVRFKEHYSFEAVFCNPNKGNEKGNVENKVGYLRRNMLVPMPVFDDINIFNKELLNLCDKDADRIHYSKKENISELFKEDMKYLNPLPLNPFSAGSYESARTDSYGKFHMDGHIYSSSPSQANSTLTVLKTHDEVIVLNKDYKEVVRHERLYGDKIESIKWIPYLTQLARKPMALKYSGIYEMIPKSVKKFMENGNKSGVLKLLAQLTEESDFETAIYSIEKALEHNATDLDSVIALNRSFKDIYLEPMKLPDYIPSLNSLNIDIKKYDTFLMGEK